MNERILIVEDHPLHMKLMEMTLRDKNYTLLKATDGEAALDVATNQRPDLILTDIVMPNMDGYALGVDAYIAKTITLDKMFPFIV